MAASAIELQPFEDMVVWDYDKPMGGLSAEQIKKARMILWKGFCSVHQMFKPEQIENFRREVPGGKVISHPEASFEVCQQSDYVGSTEFIINTIQAAEEDTHWLVGLLTDLCVCVCVCLCVGTEAPHARVWAGGGL